MEFGRNTNPDYPHPYVITFTPDESQTATAAYSEEVYRQAEAGRQSQDFLANIATWESNGSHII